ncbi:MAG: hypothetical protein DRP70_15460 [Spirochaetes bacterium]|nr:MAG: hypothetical protein DRP70_15460 [Spirochaetota bacterium]
MNNSNARYDSEEIEILEAYESGKINGPAPSESMVQAAQKTLRKNRNINIRISENDLESIKLRAAREGMPYQTLIGSLIHKYASGYIN